MITAQTKIDLRLFEAPLSLIAEAGESTIFQGHSDFGKGQFSPALDKAIQSICTALGIETFLKTEVKLTEVFAYYDLSQNRLFVEAIIPLEHSTASLILNYQPSKTNPNERDFAAILDLKFYFDLADLPVIANDLDEPLRLTLAFANNDQTIETIGFQGEKSKKIIVDSGVSLQPNIDFPNEATQSFNYELVDFTPTTETPTDLRNNLNNLPKLPEQKGTKWFDLDKNIGGLNFRKIGMRWHQSKAWVLLNLDYMSSGLEFSLLGLQAGSALNLKTFQPKFDLHGIGVYFKNNLIEIGGSLLKSNNDKTPTDYIGKMLMRLSSMSIGAIGGLTKTADGKNNFFAFANIGVPMGGIPAFFINGLSAGFGYNSELNLPSASNIADFPLLNIIKTGKKSPSEALEYLGNTVTPKQGEKWLAAGIQFSSFQLINSNAILTYQFGQRKMSILGVSRLVLPSEKAAYLNLEFGLKAMYETQTGEIQSNAQLAEGSYLIHKNVQLEGSVAVYTWLKGENAGDFVLTIGGYHPRFEQPKHYPTVPKVGFSWIVSDTTKIEGNTYFALTSQAIMAGFTLDATYEKGRLKAWFKANTDLILQWKPFYYDFHTKIRLGAKYQSRFIKNYKLDIGADLHLYGPEMGGYVNINWTIISFAIKFGNPDKSRFIYVLNWEMFQNSFLPQQEKEICRVTITNGLIEEKAQKNTNEENNIWISNLDNLTFATQSLIPSNKLILNGQSVDISSDMLGVRPMNKRYLESTQTVTIRHKNGTKSLPINFKHEVNRTNFSPALWSPKPLKRQQLDSEQLQSIAGFNYLMPIATPTGNLAKAKREVFETEEKAFLSKFNSETEHITAAIESDKHTISTIATSINTSATIENRTNIINELNEFFEFSDSELLPNNTLNAIENNAAQIFQSEPKIGQIQRNEPQLATPKMTFQPTVKTKTIDTEVKAPTMRFSMKGIGQDINIMTLPNELTTRGIKPTATDKKVIIKTGSAYVFEFDDKDDKRLIRFECNVLTQVIEFNEYNHLLAFHILPLSVTEYKALPNTKRLALRSTDTSTHRIVQQLGGLLDNTPDGWKHTDLMPLVNENALLGDKVLVQLQVPMADEDETHGTVKQLNEKNFIKTQNGIEKGYIDTLIFNDYREIVLVVKQIGQKISDAERCAAALRVTVPHTYRNNFTRKIKKRIKPLFPVTAAVDANGLVRIKFKISNKKINKKSENDWNWNAFTLRIQANENWEIRELMLFEGLVKKEIWMNL